MSQGKVVRCYHFCDDFFGPINLRNRRLKIATIMELNDPFELLVYSHSDREVRRHIGEYKKQMARAYGFICFSEAHKSPVQWAHYSNKHKGICLGFDVDAERLKKVVYRSSRVKFDFPSFVEMSKAERAARMAYALNVKHSEWSYERELRIMPSLHDSILEDSRYFLPFDKFGVLREVIIGCNSHISPESVRAELYGAERVAIWKARPAFNSYNIVQNKSAVT
ncbi:DUF2971 domain-containing protein [Pseudomonas aeruginosa]|uniref:DUF2971 domain-containing protein n=1 Tax=Pseudomonas aeruginosa TaxID=287 RepID=UPI000F53BC7B|nr:DUF2971 domain-containing protein [Pseudomonas aeruginosa]EKY1746269.1 DUF2971 domain-containing protein [Pseudomonas aeruginosa]MBG3962722.1 DUF2971 domain-containing protein [Pseudomonas aeruginosa]MBG6931728.1 DUF2971 domain-containing protein [Pseudomonas aeruginosa]MBG6946517.1 DUF2971 domain-containing protein [Pseudomonas aeruginosa]MBG7345458.1 DUF2971 domain-containing protein [Pseudomonas aeruginosa]